MRAGRCGVMAGGAVVRTLPTILTILTVFASAQGRQPSFQGLGDLPGWPYESKATAISADGTVVVGYSSSDRGEEAFRWTEAEGMVTLTPGGGPLPNGWDSITPKGVSYDGAMITGDSRRHDDASPSGNVFQPFRWTAGEGIAALPGMPDGSHAYDLSADGSVVVGVVYPGVALRWTAETGAVDLGDPDGYTSSLATAVSGDGLTVAGMSGGDAEEGWRWTAEGGFEGVGNLRGEGFHSGATGISADGTTLVGFSNVAAPDGSTDDTEAFRWTAGGGMTGLGDLPGGWYFSIASNASGDGSVIVGWSRSERGMEAFIWDEIHGMRALRDVLLDDYGIDTTAWQDTYATGVSADGTVVVGYGDNPNGDVEAWVAVIPEPGALLFLASGMPLLTLRRSRVR